MVLVPRAMAESWIHKNSLGVRRAMPLAGGESLHILVEKDFECLQSRKEDEKALFTNPRSVASEA